MVLNSRVLQAYRGLFLNFVAKLVFSCLLLTCGLVKNDKEPVIMRRSDVTAGELWKIVEAPPAFKAEDFLCLSSVPGPSDKTAGKHHLQR